MAKNIENRINFFSFIPKESVSGVFFVWFFNFLDEPENQQKFMQLVFDKLILKKEDLGREIKFVNISSVEGGAGALLSFQFKDSDRTHCVLLVFGDANGCVADQKKLSFYAIAFPSSYRYLYFKIGYVNTLEEQLISSGKFELINACMMESALANVVHLNQYIQDFQIYLHTEVYKMNEYYERIFLQHDKNALQETDGQQYLLHTVLENIEKTIGTLTSSDK